MDGEGGCEDMNESRVMGREGEEEYKWMQWEDILGIRVVKNGFRHVCIKRGRSELKHPSIE